MSTAARRFSRISCLAFALLLVAPARALAQPFAYALQYSSTTPAASAQETLVVIDVNTRQVVASIALGEGEGGDVVVSRDGTRAYASRTTDVAVVDLTTNRVIGSLPAGAIPGNLALSPDGTRLYAGGFSTLRVLSTATGQILQTVALGGQVYDMAVTADGTRVYVTVGGGLPDKLQVAHLDTGLVDTIITGTAVADVAVDPDGTRAYAVPR